MQLQYQDPTNPMDNTDMLAQEAQFSTLEQMEALQSGFSEFANIYKANSLMGQVVDIDNNGSDVTGVVEYVNFNECAFEYDNFNDYYNMKISQGKLHYNALGHCAGKLIRNIFYMLKNNITFNLD